METLLSAELFSATTVTRVISDRSTVEAPFDMTFAEHIEAPGLADRKKPGPRPKYNHDNIIEAIRFWVATAAPTELTGKAYRSWQVRTMRSSERPPDILLPSEATIARYFVTFAAALEAAGFARPVAAPDASRLAHVEEQSGLTPEEELCVKYALSVYLGGTFRAERTDSYVFCRIMGALAGVDGPGQGGAWQSSKSVLRAVGIDAATLATRWEVVEATTRLLPREVLAAFVPPRLWRAIFALIASGPFDAVDQVRGMLRAWANGLEADGSPRRGSTGSRKSTLANGALSESTLRGFRNAFMGFMNTLDHLRSLERNGKLTLPIGSAYFRLWVKQDFPPLPRVTELGAAPAETTRDAPTLRLVRLRLQIFCEDIAAAKKTAKGRAKLFQLLRDRALIATLANTGLRRGAFNNLSVGDVVADYAFSSGERGPAIVPRPGKTVSKHLKRPKGIPTTLFDWIKEYCEYAGIWGDDDAPLWLPNRQDRRDRQERIDDDGIYQIVCARFEQNALKAGLPPESRPLQRAFFEEHDGRIYSPHQLRHSAEQVAFVVGLDWLEDNRSRLLESTRGLPSNPQVFADALLDHSMESMGDLYKDVASERGREHWARECALGIGEYLYGDKGARRGPDVQQIEQARTALRHAENRRVETEEQLRVLEEKLISSGDTLDLKEILLAQTRLTGLARRLAALAEETERARSSVATALASEVPVADSVDKKAFALLFDEASQIAGASPEDEGDAELTPLRDWATLEEFHWALGGQTAVSIGTVRRWSRGEPTKLGAALGMLPRRDATPPDCILRISERKQRVLLDRLDWSVFPRQVQENLDAIRHTAIPSSKTTRPIGIEP